MSPADEELLRAIFQHGVDVGYARRCDEESAEWRALAEHVRKYSRMKTHTELELARWGGPRDKDYPGAR